MYMNHNNSYTHALLELLFY